MPTTIPKVLVETTDAILIPFNEYNVHYYSQSSAPWEAAYISCFQNNGPDDIRQVGYMVFTYPQHIIVPGQEPTPIPGVPVDIPGTQMNYLEQRDGHDFFVMYYALNRFNDVVNMLRYCNNGSGSMIVSANPFAHVWALCNNLHIPNGAQFQV